MNLSDVATIRTDFPDADFWLVRRGTLDRCGEPQREFNPEHIGVKVQRTDLLLPTYLFYLMMHVHQQGFWKARATGTTRLVNIQTDDVRGIELQAG